jgi:metallo-beta-lactamase family protein
VKATVEVMGSFSAHGDYEEMLHVLSCQNAEKVKRVFVVHGEAEVQDHFAERLRKKGFKEVHAPEMHESFELK